MSTVLITTLSIIALIVYGIYRMLKLILKKTRKSIRYRRRVKEYKRAECEAVEFVASIDRTSIIDRRKVFDSNRKYHYETTFMIFFKNYKKTALTVKDGSHQYDALMSRLED